MAAVKHSRDIEKTGTGDDAEYAVSCSCRTFYRSRLNTYAAATAADAEHKATVADGSWAAGQAEHAARMEALAPLHEAQREHFDAKEARQSAGFGVLIAKQHGGDVEAARADLEAAKARLEAAEAALAAVQA